MEDSARAEAIGPGEPGTLGARQRAWEDAYRRFANLDSLALGAEELQAFADAAWWTSHLDESIGLRQRAYAAFVEAGDDRRAAYAAWFLYFDHLWFKGNPSVASGWFRRAERHLAVEPECVEHGYLAFAQATAAEDRGELAEAASRAREAIDVGQRFADRGLVTLALQELGHVLASRGEVAEGTALLDEAMCSVLADDLHPMIIGWVFCSVLTTCFEMADVTRAREWTEAAVSWCESLPHVTPFHGLCRVHRVEVRTLRGDWSEAEADAVRASGELLALEPAVAGEAFFAMGEVRRRRGRLVEAEAAFRRAHELGRDPQPGLALLRLAQGKMDDASALLRLPLATVHGPPLTRARLLAAQVEIAVAAGDPGSARRASRELDRLSSEGRASVLEATAAMARAALQLAEHQTDAAVRSAARAWTLWEQLRMPYEAARARVLLGRACALAGDEARARMELDAAATAFARLGADQDLRELRTVLEPAPHRPGGLSAREVEVLALLAAGKTNRQIAAELVVSEHTVSRHVQNIFTKLQVSSRAAAAAFAVEHDLH